MGTILKPHSRTKLRPVGSNHKNLSAAHGPAKGALHGIQRKHEKPQGKRNPETELPLKGKSDQGQAPPGHLVQLGLLMVFGQVVLHDLLLVSELQQRAGAHHSTADRRMGGVHDGHQGPGDGQRDSLDNPSHKRIQPLLVLWGQGRLQRIPQHLRWPTQRSSIGASDGMLFPLRIRRRLGGAQNIRNAHGQGNGPREPNLQDSQYRNPAGVQSSHRPADLLRVAGAHNQVGLPH
mmetsp:Transcript_12522/g.31248  ORF Transcript_12522/g.31248 Transcript_12522/m.31248 type:complete len:234 (+) Transcript_12522:100-801(+)